MSSLSQSGASKHRARCLDASDAGTSTAELAVCFPIIAVMLGAILSGGHAVAAKVACVDGSRIGARAAARGDTPETVISLARQASGDSAAISVESSTIAQQAVAVVTVKRTVQLLPPAGPLWKFQCRAVASTEGQSHHNPAHWRTGAAGSASILMLAVALLALIVLGAVVGVGSAVIARHRASAAADLAALAAADVLMGRAAGQPCSAARALARAGGGELMVCETVGQVAEISVAIRPPGFIGLFGFAYAKSRAGPASARTV
ncbi:MAG: Rv3654c family TadE-like protein [Actinomycetota bacterium]